MSTVNKTFQILRVQDAIQAFELVMENKIDHQTAYNLTVCYFVLGNREQMKNCFTKMLLVKYYDSDSDDENDEENSILRVCIFHLSIDRCLEQLLPRANCEQDHEIIGYKISSDFMHYI